MDPRFNPREATLDSEEIVSRYKGLSETFRLSAVKNISQLDASYGPDPNARYDLFLPTTHPQSLLLFVHGGFWFSRDKSDFSFMAKAHVELGSAVGILTYPKCPHIALPDLMDLMSGGLNRLVQDLQSRFALESSQTALIGHSAGAHLVANAILHSSESAHIADYVGLCVLASGIYDTDLVCEMELNRFIGLDRNETAITSLAKRPIELKYPGRCKFVSITGGREPVCWQKQVDAYMDRLVSEKALSVQAEVLAGHDHFTLLEVLSNPSSEVGLLIDSLKSKTETSRLS